MAIKKAESPSFEVYFSLKVDVGVTIKAATFEDALTEARKLKAFDIIDDEDRTISDSEPAIITGVYKSS